MNRGIVHTARAEDVYPTLEPGSVSMVWSDGPYAVGKDTWDRMKPADLPAWYEPHIREWGRICAPSATIYHWGTADGWARVHPVYLAAGWTFRALITWDKGIATLAGRLDTESMRTWPDVTEVCGFYQREGFDISAMARGEVYHNLDEQRCAIEAARFLTSERERAGLTRKALAAYFPSKTGGLTGCVTNWEEGYNFPTWDIWRRLHAALNEQPGAPYLQRDRSNLYDERALRSEYEALRAPFALPLNTTNVWRDPVPQGGVRLDHPCQKPLSAVRRAILASTVICAQIWAICFFVHASKVLMLFKPRI
jgi:site-specific DNA-methyltransferase (adenine-specific)